MFRRPKSTKKLSADELKSKLYAHFDRSGSLNQLRTQLRGELVSELLKIASPSMKNEPDNPSVANFDKTLLPLQVCNWLIYDHLLRQGYQYALSTFVTETNLPCPEKLLTAGDILGLFGLDNSAPEFKKISEVYTIKNENGHLNSLLLSIIISVFELSNKGSQKDERQKTEPVTGIESEITIPSYHNNLQEQDNSADGHYIENIFSKGNKPEPHKSNLQEQLQLIKEEKNREIQNLRHRLLQELERLHSQERSLHQELDLERKEIKKDREILSSEKDKIKEKEMMFIKEQENKYEKKLREIEESYVAKLHAKKKEVEFLHKKIEDREKKLDQMEFELSSRDEKLGSLKRELNDINQMYKSIHEKYNTLLDENTNLVKKFENMSDYNIIKEELSMKSKEILNLQQEIEKLHKTAGKDRQTYTETVTSLELRLRSTEPKLHQMQRELNQARDTLHMEEAVWSKEKTKLEQESTTAKELYKTVLQRIEEQKQDIQDLHQTIHILHYQLTNKDINYPLKLEPTQTEKLTPASTFLSSKNKIEKSLKNNPVYLSQKYRENALNFTSEYKNRLSKLQQEITASYDKYSLIYCTSLEGKTTKSEFLPRDNQSLFPYNNTPSNPILSHHSANKSSDLLSGIYERFVPSVKKLLPSRDINIMNQNSEFSNLSLEKYPGQKIHTDVSVRRPHNLTKFHTADDTATKDIIPPSDNQSDPHSSEYQEYASFQAKNKVDPLYSNATSAGGFQSNQNTLKKLENEKLNETQEESSPSELKKKCHTDSNLVERESNLAYLSLNTLKTTGVLGNKSSVLQKPELSHADSKVFDNTSKLSYFDTSDIKSIQKKSNIFTQDLESTLEQNKDNSSAQSIIYPTNNTDTIAEIPTQSETSATEPILVDLDAAWKRKTSLPAVSSPVSQKLDSLKTHTIVSETITKKTNFESKECVSIHEDAPVNNKIESSNTTEIKTEISIDSTAQEKNNGTKINESASNTEKHISEDNQVDESKTVTNQGHSYKNDLVPQVNYDAPKNKSYLSGDMSGTDDEAKKDFSKSPSDSDVKHIPEDSLSELSEVHVSCGSEQEEQKEESDNW